TAPNIATTAPIKFKIDFVRGGAIVVDDFYLGDATPDINDPIKCYTDSGKGTEISENTWQNDGSVYFEWTVPTELNATYYYAYNTNSEYTINGTESTTTNKYLNNFTLTGGDYYLHIKPKNFDTWGLNQRKFRIKYDGTVPTTITDLNAGNATLNSIDLSWTVLTHDGLSLFVKYEIYYKAGSEPTLGDYDGIWTSANDANLSTITTNSTTVTGLTSATTYYFKIRGIDSAGNAGTLSTNSCSLSTIGGNNTPANGSVNADTDSGKMWAGKLYTFTATYSDADGYTDIDTVYILINDSTNGANCFYAAYHRTANKFFLRNDANDAWLDAGAPGSMTTRHNSYAYLDSSCTVAGAGNTLTVSWKIRTKFQWDDENCNVYLNVIDAPAASPGLQAKNTVTVDNDLQISNFSTTPANGAASTSPTVQFTGNIYYEGTAIIPPDLTEVVADQDYIGVRAYVFYNGGITANFDSTYQSGFDVSANAAGTGTHTWNIRLMKRENAGDWTTIAQSSNVTITYDNTTPDIVAITCYTDSGKETPISANTWQTDETVYFE
ncbi:MAG TPA: fibronectin type III domain-containing protein, partial [bacterium]|nr:fibronectin type III domain-containing protein [bacterium]